MHDDSAKKLRGEKIRNLLFILLLGLIATFLLVVVLFASALLFVVLNHATVHLSSKVQTIIGLVILLVLPFGSYLGMKWLIKPPKDRPECNSELRDGDSP